MASSRSRSRRGPTRPRAAAARAPAGVSPAAARALLVGAVVIPLLARLIGLLGAWTSVVFWIAGLGAVVLCTVEVLEARSAPAEGEPGLLLPLLALVVLVPVVFDPRVLDAFAAPKLAVVAPGGIAVAAVWCLGARARGIRWRNGVHWPALALLLWSIVAGVGSGSPGLALIGADLSADGLLLLAGCVATFFAVSGGLRSDDVVRVVRVLVIGAGGIVVLYGGLQLHDRVWGGAWDWAPWGDVSFSKVSIWSTLGNPNHLAGFLAAIVPLGIALLIVDQRRWVQALTGVVVVLAVVEQVQAGARGGWVASVASLGALALLLLSELRARARVVVVGAALVAGGALAGVALGSHSVSLGDQLRSFTQLDGVSTISERVDYWSASVEIGAEHPMLGVGPDGFRFAFPAVQDADYVEVFGREQVVNGPHNTFLNQLVTTGIPGLVALCALLVGVAVRGLVAWRRSIDTEAAGRRDRVLLAGSLASLVALVVQGLFNVQQVPLTFLLWLCMGLILVFTRAIPSTARPRVFLGRVEPVPEPARRRPAASWVVPTGAALAVAALVSVWPASAPWRGEVAYAAAIRAQRAGAAEKVSAAESQASFARATTKLADAIDANPWRARYLEVRGSGTLDAAKRHADPGSSEVAVLAERAISDFQSAVDLEPGNARLREGLGDAHSFAAGPSGDPDALEAAVASYRASLQRNPWVTRVRSKLATALVRLQREEEALAELNEGLELRPDLEVYRALARTYDSLGDPQAEHWWREAHAYDPTDTEARAMVESLEEAAG